MHIMRQCCSLWLWYLVCWWCCESGCSTDPEPLPQDVIDNVKASLLPLFGLQERPPKIEGNPVVPQRLLKLYRMQNAFDMETASFPLPGLHTESANTVRSFAHVESVIDSKFKTPHKFRLKFDVSSIPEKEKLKAAELQITRRMIDPQLIAEGDHKVRILLHDITRKGKKGVHPPITMIIDSKMIDLRKNSTISLDIEPAVVRWLENPKKNYGVLVEMIGGADKPQHLRLKRDASDPDELSWDANQPLMLTYTDDGRNEQRTGAELRKVRRRRTPRKRKSEPCRRLSMTVTFSTVGWADWIVAPRYYEAYYCTGACEYPMAEHMNTTNHAIVQSLMNSARPGEVPKPCCVPTELSAMSMLYYDDKKKIVMKNYRDMIVIGCGCR